METFISFSTMILLVFGIFITCSAENMQLFEGSKFVITGQSNCDNFRSGKEIVHRDIKITKFNRTHHHIYNNFTLPFDFDNNITVGMDVKRKTSNGVVNVIKVSSQLCTFINKYMKNTLRELFETGGHVVENCPIPKGNYLWNSVLDMKLKNIPYSPYGDYETTATFYRGERRKKVMCIKLFIQIKPKISDNKDDTIFEME